MVIDPVDEIFDALDIAEIDASFQDDLPEPPILLTQRLTYTASEVKVLLNEADYLIARYVDPVKVLDEDLDDYNRSYRRIDGGWLL